MGFWSKLVILMLGALAFFYVKVNFFDTPHTKVEKKLVAEEQVTEEEPDLLDELNKLMATSKEDMIEKIKQETRRYAKRQITWFKKNKQTIWIGPHDLQKILDTL